MDITLIIREQVVEAVKNLYQAEVTKESVLLNPTRKEFDGDYTVVVFPYSKAARKRPDMIGDELGKYLVEHVELIDNYNVIKGFLNLSIGNAYWSKFLHELSNLENYGYQKPNGKKIIVEFSSPNTNKPLHLGHVRNILLGWSTSKIKEAAGFEVIKTQIINDRGVHICKSMVAWEKYANGETPASSGMKGDKLIGKYYVTYNTVAEEQEKELEDGKEPPILTEARAMLKKWEANDPDVRALWAKMNSWVYAGFDETYANLGVTFDHIDYESNTYLLGKDVINKNLEKGIFYRKDDGSVWIDLEDAKLDHKLVLRSDGTSVYMTQDIGTAQQRYEKFKMDSMAYVVGDEQNYHFKVLFEILDRLGESYASDLVHLSYGMVDLPTGKMKSRTGTVVDADDLIEEVIQEARTNSEERGALEVSEEEKLEIWRRIGLAALKYHILKVHPKKRIIFNPAESVDLQGQTGPYIQNAFVRVSAVFRKFATDLDESLLLKYTDIEQAEKDILLLIRQFPEVITSAAKNYDPSEVAHFAYDLAKTYHKFYHDISILRAETEEAKAFRLVLSKVVASVLKTAMNLLGIEMPERM